MTQAARKHRIGAARIAYVLELEVIGVLVDIDGEPAMLIIHAMPTTLRRK